MKIDLHGLTIGEAKNEALLQSKQALKEGEKQIDIIAGHHLANLLGRYFDSDKFLQALQEVDSTLRIHVSTSSSGITTINAKKRT